jgi:Bacterial RNA polymerase, alpha chain C terminal domain
MSARPQKITFAEMRSSGVRGLLIYCSDYRCSHYIAISGDRWPDDVRLSDLEPKFVCTACGKRGADVRPDFHWDKPVALSRAIDRKVRVRRPHYVEEMSELEPTPELPDKTPTREVRFPTRIKNVLFTAGLETVGEVRETSDKALLSLPDFGRGSVAHLRETLGPGKKPA